MQGDIKNKNGRMYPKDVLLKEVNRYNKEYVAKNRAYGELGHTKDNHQSRKSITYDNTTRTRWFSILWVKLRL